MGPQTAAGEVAGPANLAIGIWSYSMRRLYVKFCDCAEGATAIEYAMIAAMIALGIITTAAAIGVELGTIFTDVKTGLATRAGA